MTAPAIEVMEAAKARLVNLSFEFARMKDRHGDGPACRNRANDLNEAINAVAELIDEAETAVKLLHNFIESRAVSESYRPHLDDLRAALARVQGGAA